MAWREYIPKPGTVQAVAWAVIALSGIYYVRKLQQAGEAVGGAAKAAHKAGSDFLKPGVDFIGDIITDIRFSDSQYLNTDPWILMRPKDFDGGRIKSSWLEIARQSHPGNAKIISFAFDATGQLLEPYRSAQRGTEVFLIRPDGTTESM